MTVPSAGPNHPVSIRLIGDRPDFEARLKPLLRDEATIVTGGDSRSITAFGFDGDSRTGRQSAHLVVADFRRPEVLQGAARILDQAASAAVRVLAVLSEETIGSRDTLLRAGAADWVLWSAEPREFVARVQAAVHGHPQIVCLIVEDDAEIRGAIRRLVDDAGITGVEAGSIADARSVIAGRRIDIMVVDRQLPDGDGLSFVATIRDRCVDVPALILTVRDQVTDRVAGLEAGANDYMGKPFDRRELLARLIVLLRPRLSGNVLMIGGLEIHRRDGLARWRGRRIDLTDREWALLRYLAERDGIAIPASMVRADVWGVVRQHTETNLVATGIRRLRRKLRDAGVPEVVATDGDGYRFQSGPLLGAAASPEAEGSTPPLCRP